MFDDIIRKSVEGILEEYSIDRQTLIQMIKKEINTTEMYWRTSGITFYESPISQYVIRNLHMCLDSVINDLILSSTFERYIVNIIRTTNLRGGEQQ